MLKKVMGVKVNYIFNDINADKTLVLLHGWGQNIEMMMFLGDKLNKYNILALDLPGFGKSSEPDYSWEVTDYVECVKNIVDDLELKNITLIGHSFGGKISLIYASKHKIDSLICLASPFCPEMKKIPFKTKVYKTVKKIKCLKWLANIIKKRVGSTDYKNASEIMKGVLVKSINLNMIDEVKQITCPTMLIWGDKDTAVPINRAYELNGLIKNSKLIVYKEATHYAYLEHKEEVIKEIDQFIGGN